MDTEAIPIAANFINLILFGTNVLARGESARAWAMLSLVHNHLLKLVRLTEGSTAHWWTPSKGLENDLPESILKRYRSCTAGLDEADLWRAYRETWKWGRELMPQNNSLPTSLLDALSERITVAALNSTAD
jgi:lincosamide nucleotidyltransferase